MENSKELYDKCWDILVEHAGAPKDPREKESFVRACMSTDKYDKLREWRFCGHLGFGGKFWREDGRLYISCYPEDENKERNKIVNKVNELLKEITPNGGAWGPPGDYK